jgi:hypothetical protein
LDETAPSKEPAGEEAVEALARIARGFDLEPIHRRRGVRVASNDPLFGQLLAGDS